MRPTPWWRRQLALALIHLIPTLERSALRAYDLARRLAPMEFQIAEALNDQQRELEALPEAPPRDYDPDERRRW